MLNLATTLRDPSLLRQAILIDGAWVQADSGRTLEVRNPATGQVLAEVPDAGALETHRAIAAAERAQRLWRTELPAERARILRRLYDLVIEHLEDLALTIHAHPTLSETPMFAAEMGLGVITDLYVPKKK